MSGDPWIARLTAEQERERDLALATEERLAETVGIECLGCGGTIYGCLAIGAWTYMAPMGSGDYCARAYCRSCAEALLGEHD